MQPIAGEAFSHVSEADLAELGISSVSSGRPDAVARRVRFLRDAIGHEVTPPGFEDVVLKLKDQPGVDNPWAVAWAMRNRGVQPKSEAGAPYQPDALLKRLRFEESNSSAAMGALFRKAVHNGREANGEGSFFSRCERDAGGQCLPEGDSPGRDDATKTDPIRTAEQVVQAWAIPKNRRDLEGEVRSRVEKAQQLVDALRISPEHLPIQTSNILVNVRGALRAGPNRAAPGISSWSDKRLQSVLFDIKAGVWAAISKARSLNVNRPPRDRQR